ncbi:hypothetical protein SCLCIDRAFT_34193 [Scleroderma citrinum Foug A]|uniref:Uncharacterized protein n=1 Tax=Scleroderma citrinum Foug A TaxID=1036808 RepID=A0A0C3D339_9AGAM|nr:hypothetical protein SCLCIDRAFT_34193 [Scleroderma citrinum Foug A]
MIEDALARFHSYRKVFWNVQVVAMFSLPRQHSMKHYPYLIRQFSTPNGLCSSITKSKHIKAVKQPYRRTNRFQALRQMLVINQRLDKFAAARADLEKHGMLRGTCLSHVSNNRGHEDGADESNSPMSVKAHISLAQTYQRTRARNMRSLATKLDIPQLVDILHCFLQSQLQHDNRNPEDVPLDECPFYDGPVNVYNSTSSMFYAPSDPQVMTSHSSLPLYSIPLKRYSTSILNGHESHEEDDETCKDG